MTDADLPDLEDPKRRLAQHVKTLDKVALPRLKYWNYDACARHVKDGPQIDCKWQACGGDFFDHQTTTISYLYLNGHGMVASVPGAGKTNSALGLAALLKERGELTGRAVIIVQTPAVLQWMSEAQRFIPKMRVEGVYSGLSKANRRQRYIRNWDVLIMGYHMLLKDHAELKALAPQLVITDDVDPLLNHDNKTHRHIVEVASQAERVVVMNASNLQNHLSQLHAAMAPMGGREIWGSLPAFERRYLRTEPIRIWQGGRPITISKTVGLKNMNELKEKLYPWVIRHGYDDLKDVRMPEVMPPENIWLEMLPEQRALYEELREGVLRVRTEQGEKVKQVTALTMIGYGQAICAGVPALRDGSIDGASVKLDWLIERLQDEWSDRKIVVFIKNTGLIEALQKRLRQVNIGYATVWGKETDPQARREEQQRFWRDDQCRVFMGTSAIERSLNLQAANVIVNVDTHLNPERMKQILGRVRRSGSKHSHVWVFNLFCVNSQEEGYLDVLRRRAAVADFVWGEESELYEKLSSLELLQLIRP